MKPWKPSCKNSPTTTSKLFNNGECTDTTHRQNTLYRNCVSSYLKRIRFFVFSFHTKEYKKYFDLLRKVDDYRTYVRLRIDFACLRRACALAGVVQSTGFACLCFP